MTPIRPLHAALILVGAGAVSMLVGMQSVRPSAGNTNPSADAPALRLSAADAAASDLSQSAVLSLGDAPSQPAAKTTARSAQFDEERADAKERLALARPAKARVAPAVPRQAASVRQSAPVPPAPAAATPTPAPAGSEADAGEAPEERDRRQADVPPPTDPGAKGEGEAKPEPTECETECVIEFPTDEPTPEPPPIPTDEPPAPTEEPPPPADPPGQP